MSSFEIPSIFVRLISSVILVNGLLTKSIDVSAKDSSIGTEAKLNLVIPERFPNVLSIAAPIVIPTSSIR